MVQIHPKWTQKFFAVLLGCFSVSWDAGRGEIMSYNGMLMIFDERLTYQLSQFIEVACSFYSQHLYMHCEISVGSFKPTSSAKSCTYNQSTERYIESWVCCECSFQNRISTNLDHFLRWEELYGSNDACFCCDSTCLSSDLSGKKCQVILGQFRAGYVVVGIYCISFHSTALRASAILLV